MENPSKPPKNDDSSFYVQGFRYAALVFEFVGLLLILGYIGYRLDASYGSDPWGLLAGLLVGMGFGLFMLIKQLEKLNR